VFGWALRGYRDLAWIEAEFREGIVEKVPAFKPGISGIPTQELVGGD